MSGWFNDNLLAAGGYSIRATEFLPRARRSVEAALLMHELGHNLGLFHGGADSTTCKPNYLSVMNYSFAQRNLDPTRPLDYSRASLPTSPRLHPFVHVHGPRARRRFTVNVHVHVVVSRSWMQEQRSRRQRNSGVSRASGPTTRSPARPRRRTDRR